MCGNPYIDIEALRRHSHFSGKRLYDTMMAEIWWVCVRYPQFKCSIGQVPLRCSAFVQYGRATVIPSIRMGERTLCARSITSLCPCFTHSTGDCGGVRNRLPATDSDWTTHFTVNLLANASDESLPISHTVRRLIFLPTRSSLSLFMVVLLLPSICLITPRWRY